MRATHADEPKGRRTSLRVRNATSPVGLKKAAAGTCGQVDAMSALSQLYPDQTGGGGLRQRRLSAHRRTLGALAVSAVAGLTIFATAAGSLMGGAMAAPPAVKSPPPGWIDLAFADVDAASARPAMQPQPTRIAPLRNAQKQSTRKPDAGKTDPCADFVYFFLNTNCSVKHVSAMRRDGFAHRAVAASPVPAPSKQEAARSVPAPRKQQAARGPERFTFAATTTTAAD